MSLFLTNVSSKFRTSCNLYSTSVSNTVVSIDAIYGNISQSATTISAHITYHINPFVWVSVMHVSGWLQQLENLNWQNLRSVYQNTYRENGKLEASLLCLFLTVLHPTENTSWTSYQQFVLHMRNSGWSYYEGKIKLPPFVADIVKIASDMGLQSCYISLLMLHINFTKSLKFESVSLSDLLNPESRLYATRNFGLAFIACLDIIVLQAAFPNSFDKQLNLLSTSSDTIEIWDIQNYASSTWKTRIREICSFISYEENPIQTISVDNDSFYQPSDPGLTSTPCVQGSTTVIDGSNVLIDNQIGYIFTNFNGATKPEMALISGAFFVWDIMYTSTRPNAVSPLNFIQRLSSQQISAVSLNGPDTILVNPLMGLPTPESQDMGYKTLVSRAREESRLNSRKTKGKRNPQLNQPRPTATSAAVESNDLNDSNSLTSESDLI